MESTDIGDLILQYAHLTDQEIEGYVDKTLDTHSLETVEKHLRSCSHCSKEVEILREALKDTSLVGDPDQSDDLVRQQAVRILDRISPDYDKVWLGERSFPLEPLAERPGLLRIGGDLVLAEFEDAVDNDREVPGSYALRTEGRGLNPITVPLRDFKDMRDIDVEELKLVAKAESGSSQEASHQHLELELVFVCHLPDRTFEIYGDKLTTILFLRLT